MKRLLSILLLTVILGLSGAGVAFADNPHSGASTGRPSQSCEALRTTPGHSASAPGNGSPFIGEDSTGGSHYSPTSQYDVACFQQSRH
jgi:hypothetical protein